MIRRMQLRLTIGDFSRMTYLSVKALRHYHEIGLLEPVELDPGSGYRLYDAEQVPTAQVIRRLRDLGMALDDVRRVLQAPDVDSRNRVIVGHLRRMEAALGQTKASVESLRLLLDAPRVQDLNVEFRSVPQTHSIAISERVTWQNVETWWLQAFRELHGTAATAKVTRSGPDGALYPSELFEQEVGDVVAYIPVAGNVRPIGRVKPYDVPPGEFAFLLHNGPFGDLDQTYAALGKFVAERALGISGPIREYYLVTPFDTPDESSHRTEVAWPVFQTSKGSSSRKL